MIAAQYITEHILFVSNLNYFYAMVCKMIFIIQNEEQQRWFDMFHVNNICWSAGLFTEDFPLRISAPNMSPDIISPWLLRTSHSTNETLCHGDPTTCASQSTSCFLAMPGLQGIDVRWDVVTEDNHFGHDKRISSQLGIHLLISNW